jgi:hypothetical protein
LWKDKQINEVTGEGWEILRTGVWRERCIKEDWIEGETNLLI